MVWRRVFCGLAAAFLTVSLAAGEETPDSSARLTALIQDLDSSSFATRDSASEELLKAGPAAIEPLARAAGAGSPETAARSLEVLNRIYATNQDASFDATEAVLFTLMKSPRTATRDRATRILEMAADQRLARAVAELEKLGALVKYNDPTGVFAAAPTPARRSRPPGNIIITRRWTGGDAGLKQLLRLYHIPKLRIYRTKHAAVSDEALDAVANDMGNVDEIQVRGEGYLGISAVQPAVGCTVSSVAEESAAAKAGLREGDVILKFGEDSVDSFQALIELLNDRVPGDKIPVIFRRNDEVMTVEVELTDWM